MIEFRRNANAGEWCVLLVPSALWVAAAATEAAASRELCLILSLFLAASSVVWARRILHPRVKASAALARALRAAWRRPPKLQEHPARKAARVDLRLCGALFALVTVRLGVFEGVLSAAAFAFFDGALPKMFEAFARSFTFGEGCVVLQSAVLFGVHAVVSLARGEDMASTVPGSFAIFSKVCLLSVFVLVSLPKSSTYFLAYAVTVFCAGTYPLLLWNLRRNPVVWIVGHVSGSRPLFMLCVFWAALVVLAVAVVASRRSKATTSVRKVFHLLVVVVFVSGFVVDRDFTFLASALVLGVFVVLEYVRAFKIQPAARGIDAAFAAFVDAKDEGSLVLTNIYLLAGTFLPLWISGGGGSTVQDLALFSGVLSVGVGDSAASIVGSKIGHFKLPRSEKTVEGTLASVAAQLLFLAVIESLGVIQVDFDLGETVLPIIIVSIVETLTTQVDNVVLPLLLYILFQV